MSVEKWTAVVLLVGSVVFCIGGGLFSLKMEADTFNKFNTTGQKATIWDAMYADLRVQTK